MSPEKIMEICAECLGMNVGDFKIRNRRDNYTDLKRVAIILIRKYCQPILVREIANLFGHNDHTTISNQYVRGVELLDVNEDLFVSKYNLCNEKVITYGKLYQDKL